MSISELEAAYFSFKFSKWIQVRLPKKVDGALFDGCEPFYLRHFEIDLRFHVMGLVEELCTWCQIHPSQLALITIRPLLCVDRLKESTV